MSQFSDAQHSIIADFMHQYDVPGAAVAIVRDGTVVATGGFGQADLARARPPTGDTRWPLASVTKSFTATAAMQQVAAGRLDLDNPITDYLPELVVANPDFTRRLSVRRLLTHSGGLGRTGHQDRTREEPVNPYPTRETLLDALHEVEPHAQPGARFAYSNEGYAIVGRIIEVVAGKPLERCFEEDIFAPLGMTRSTVRFDDWRRDDDRAYLYAGAGIGPYGSGEHHGQYAVVNLVGDYQTFLSTGGIVSTARDLGRYQIALLTPQNTDLGLNRAGIEQMLCTQYPYGDSGWGYGLGLFTMWSGTVKVVGHSGGLPGVSTYSLLIPAERTGVVVLTNRSDIKAMGLAELLANELRGELWRTTLDENLPTLSRQPLPEHAAQQPYCGTYRFRRGDAQVAAGEGGVLIRTPSRYDGPPVEIPTRYVGEDRFVSLRDGHAIDFLRNSAGDVGGFLNSGYRYQRTGEAATHGG